MEPLTFQCPKCGWDSMAQIDYEWQKDVIRCVCGRCRHTFGVKPLNPNPYGNVHLGGGL